MNVLILGDIKIEIAPREQIQISGQRSIPKYDVPGYRPRYQDMGPDERIISFEGIFIGKGALDKAIEVEDFWKGPANADDGTDKAGYPLIYEDVAYRVIIKSFNYAYRHKERVNYTMELVRLDSDSSPKLERPADQDPAAKAKSAMDKLNDLLDKATGLETKAIGFARQIGDALYNARYAWIRLSNAVRLPGLRQEFERIKKSFDRTLQTVRDSVGASDSDCKRSAAYQKSLQELGETLISANKLLDAAQNANIQQQIETTIANLPLQAVRQGENLRTIAAKLLGSHHKWIILAKLNRLTSPDIPDEITHIRVPGSSAISSAETLFDRQDALMPPAAPNYIPPYLR